MKHMRGWTKYVLPVVLVTIGTSSTWAKPETRKIRVNGSSFEHTFSEVEGRVLLHGVSRGNLSSIVSLDLEYPAGSTVRIHAAELKGSRKRLLRRRRRWFPLDVMEERRFEKTRQGCLEISLGDFEDDDDSGIEISDYPPSNHELCDVIGQDELSTVAAALEETYGGGWTVGHACTYMSQGVGDICFDIHDKEDPACEEIRELLKDLLEDDGNRVRDFSLHHTVRKSYKGIFRKNSCRKRRSKYLLIIEIIPPASSATAASEFSVSGRVQMSLNAGGREASLKPVSEGRFAPRPIFLMNWLGSNCGGQVDVVRWRKGKPVSEQRVTTYSYLVWNGLTLALSLASNAPLNGGKASVDLTNENTGYGACFSMAQRRQNLNGYPR